MSFKDDSLVNKADDPHYSERITAEFEDLLALKTAQIQRLSQIGIALSAERDISRLLEMIVDEAMSFTNADAGTLYVVDYQHNQLVFEILKNETLQIHEGGTSGKPVQLPPVPLEEDGMPNITNVSSQAALTGEIINIADVYTAIGFDFSGVKKYDAATGYRSTSMLVVPMKNHENDIIGVLQLLNAKNPVTGATDSFPKDQEPMIISLASQAAVALENAKMIKDLKALFDAFIESIATAIDEKSAYTAGHIRRVTQLTMMIAEEVNRSENGIFEDTFFDSDEMEELRIAAWLHDVGKITTPEHVVDKSTKLEGIYDRLEFIRQRFALIAQLKKNNYLQEKLAFLQAGNPDVEQLRELEERHTAALAELTEDLAFIAGCNTGFEFLTDTKRQRLEAIAAKTYHHEGEEHPYITPFELKQLSILKGTLNAEERKIIENHVSVGIRMLQQLPFPRKLSRVPEYAGGHHEKLDGSGYPNGLVAAELALQARIMAIADIFEALTAKDRPYKKPMKLSKAIDILRDMCERNHIDRDIFDLFINSGIYLRYARAELNEEQIDVAAAKA